VLPVLIMDAHPDIDLSLSWPAVYRICVRGRVASRWHDRFEGLAISTTPPGQAPVITTLKGRLQDQAALMGVLVGLYDLRLPLERVECLGSPAES
jgi:hypothetical protein